ncbi:MAG: flavodoxin family protein [Desulfobulbaceae bacterium]|jgi:multimeric flavodoxin WrbA|nr:flavodoxin family protein [Desulfobulbaceae bacterium]
MHVILMNGSPRQNGNTAVALKWMADELRQAGISTETIQIGDQIIRGCIACEHCVTSEDNLCAFHHDGINNLIIKLRQADGFIIGFPTYFGGMPGTLKSAMDRLFYAGKRNGRYRNKVGAATVLVRRDGGPEAFNQIITYYHLTEMIVAPLQTWAVRHGMKKGEICEDVEGRQTIRRHASAMAWILKMREATKDSVALPPAEDRIVMNFIR